MVDLNPDQFSEFSHEQGLLHAAGKPIRIAQHLGGTASSEHGEWHSWRIPFESGHEMFMGGAFDATGRNRAYGHQTWEGEFGPGLHVWARHSTSRLADPIRVFPSRRDPDKMVGMVRATNEAELNDAIRRVAALHGGSHGPSR